MDLLESGTKKYIKKTGEYINDLSGHKNKITKLMVLDEHTILSSSIDSTLRSWNFENQTCL